MNKLKQLWSNLRSSFWFVPSLIVVIMSRILGAFQTLAGMSNSTIATVKKGEKQ